MLPKVTNGRAAFPFLILVYAAMVSNAFAASCTTQSQMNAAQRDALSSAAHTMLTQVQGGDVQALRANTIPAVAAQFGGIEASIENLKPMIRSAAVTVDNLYLLDASTQPADASRTDFYCGQPVVALNFTDLPPGTYALAILHATGVTQPQQISLILAKTAENRWMLAGFFSKPMVELGHDGLWYWISARKYVQMNMNWNAWLYYRVASYLLNPFDLMTSANLEKLEHESDRARPTSFPGSNPMMLSAHDAVFSVTAIDTTTAFGALDLDVHYVPDQAQSSQLHDPPAARRQVVEIMSALLLQHPELVQAFHGIWVHADQGSGSLFALELPMDGIGRGPTVEPHSVER
jgi:hypothetical protein